jgi:hypothetical protein
MAVLKDKAIEEAVATTEPIIEIAPEPVVETVKVEAEPVVAAKEVAVQAKKEETVAIGGQADERVVVGGPLRGTNFAADGTAYLFTSNGVCAIFKKHLPEFQARGCAEL